jgi:hypothetical protein
MSRVRKPVIHDPIFFDCSKFRPYFNDHRLVYGKATNQTTMASTSKTLFGQARVTFHHREFRRNSISQWDSLKNRPSSTSLRLIPSAADAMWIAGCRVKCQNLLKKLQHCKTFFTFYLFLPCNFFVVVFVFAGARRGELLIFFFRNFMSFVGERDESTSFETSDNHEGLGTMCKKCY